MLLKYLNPSITCTASDSRCAFGIFAPRGIRFCLIFCSMGDLVPQFTRFTPTRSWICTNMLSLSQESSYLQSSMFALLHTMWQNYHGISRYCVQWLHHFKPAITAWVGPDLLCFSHHPIGELSYGCSKSVSCCVRLQSHHQLQWMWEKSYLKFINFGAILEKSF